PTTTEGAQIIANWNLKLKPEGMFAAELGYAAELDRISWDVNLYRSEVHDLIVLAPITLAPGQNNYDPKNSSYTLGTTSFVNDLPIYTAYGGEIGTRLAPVDGLDMGANLAVERLSASAVPADPHTRFRGGP